MSDFAQVVIVCLLMLNAATIIYMIALMDVVAKLTKKPEDDHPDFYEQEPLELKDSPPVPKKGRTMWDLPDPYMKKDD